ncbi:hypothetical protein Syun_004189 [Stephania yunnanensis]|uniref:Protein DETOXIFICATION n=1 Tax=Stephania yunnanensis TaxID=152371 RepID=A0AAP0L2K0_9MAGN
MSACAGAGRDQTTLFHRLPNDHDRLICLRQVPHYHALHGAAWQDCLGRRSPLHRLLQHHRLLPPLRPLHGHGANLLPSPWRAQLHPHGPCPPPHRSHPPRGLHPPLPPLAQRPPYPIVIRPRPRHLLPRRHPHHLLRPLPPPPLPPQPPQDLPPIPKHHQTLHARLRPRPPPPHPLNYLLVHRLRLGLPGIALASVLSDLNLLLSILLYLHHSSSLPSKPWQGLSTQNCFRDWKPILSLAIPSCISVCLEWWWYELMIVLSGLLSNAAEAVASMGILIQATSLVYIFPSAMSLAVSTRVGNELGANRPHRARASTRAALLCAVATGLVALWFTTAVRHKWGRTFVTDDAVATLTAMVMPVIGLCELGNCPQTTGCGALRGSARPCVGATINLGSFYGVGMPIAVLMGFYMDMGLMGLWLGLLAAQATCGVFMTFVVLRTDWALEAKKARQLTGSEEEQDKREEYYKNSLLDEDEEC